MVEEAKIPNNQDIDQALKEFEIKSSTEPKQATPETSKDFDTPKMIQLVIRYSGGAIKDQKQAEYVLLGVVVLNIIITIVVLKFLL